MKVILATRARADYLMFYRVEGQQITVWRVIHASRDCANETIIPE